MSGPVRLVLVAGSPMYYQAPLYRALESDPRLEFHAVFASDAGVSPRDVGYGRNVRWAADSLAGYRSSFLRKASRTDIMGGFWSMNDPDVVRVLRRGSYEVIWLHGYNSLTHSLAAVTAKALGTPLIFREEQTLINPRPLARTLVKEVALRVLFHGAYGLFIGTESRRWFEHYGVPPSKLFYSPYFADLATLDGASAQSGDVPGLEPATGPVILTVSRLVPSKQTEFILRAYAKVRKLHSATLLIVGAGEDEVRLRRIVEREEIPDVRFAGFLNRDQISAAYQRADVFALMSNSKETWGVVVNEAMEAGLPVVVADTVGCATDLVSDGRNGFVVRGGSFSALVESFRDLVSDERLRTRMGHESRKVIKAWNADAAAQGVRRAVAAAVGPSRWAAAEDR